ncbi:helix-turn-helix transcriptional regulator [Streptomyces sp. CRN 30]|uniref:helix-turn-helix domain-containing protein n=1 Tax=Streptomyces sp. CRN 30 TaxID=3075613 RepID=UPI002A817D21|nr:helix-turn-helix transcriptional regulator [Streptomyces sp. CRN 30]
MAADDFAGLLRELKERSGLSYGALGKRLHMSASTLHRYVKGEVVPTEFAPVERLARLCRATPEELLELHRRWIRADALRGVKEEQPVLAEAASEGTASEGAASEEAAADEALPAGADEESAGVTVVGDAPAPTATATGKRSRRAVYAGTGAGLVAAAALVFALLPDGDGGPEDADAAGATVSSTGSPDARSVGPSASGTSSASPSGSPSATASEESEKSKKGEKEEASARATADQGGGASAGAGAAVGAVPVTVQTTPYYWDVPCEQSFLIDRSPGNVSEPPPQQDANGWLKTLGAVAADRQQVALTVQGTGEETVVLEALHVRVVGSAAPLTWDEYAMGVGCGGGVGTKSFDISLDLGNPLATPVNGQKGFPYKVSESDPEVFYVTAHTSGHDVRWQLELDWSSGARKGTVTIDNGGTPFRTSAGQTDYYGYPLGGDKWEQYSKG